MSKAAPPVASVSIGRIGISGMSGKAARAISPAIESAVAGAAREGRVADGHRPRIRIDLPHGASERDVAAALVRALERR